MRVPLSLACGDLGFPGVAPRAPRSFTDGRVRRLFGDPRSAEDRKGLIKEPRSPASLFAAETREAFVI